MGRDQKDLMLVHPDGTRAHSIARDIEPTEHHAVADWAPDGTSIVFVVGEFYEGTSIWTVGVDGADPSLLLGPSEDCELGVNWPAYSPDGKRLLFVCVDGQFDSDEGVTNYLKVLDVGTGATSTVAAARVPEELLNPRWSNDGTTAVVELRQWDIAADRQVSSQLATVPIEGGDLTRITEPELWAGDPDWSPTDDLIVFGTFPLQTKDMSAPSRIYTIRPDGSDLTPITDGKVDGTTRITMPRWTPDGRRLLVSIAIGAGGVVGDVKLGFLELDGTVTRLGSVSGVASRMQPGS